MAKRNFILFVAVMLCALGATTAHAAGSTKVQVCHRPPDNPSNFHTITIGTDALNAHLAHGDFLGSCFGNAETLCNDGNACTIDAMDEQTETCIVPHPPVNCDDSNKCTTDSCEPSAGCLNTLIACDDGDQCTVDVCNPNDGQCAFAEKDCGTGQVCLPTTGECANPCDGIICTPIDQCHAAGQCVVSGGTGQCSDGAPLSDGTPCNDGDAGTTNDQCTVGLCIGTPVPTDPCVPNPCQHGGFCHSVSATNYFCSCIPDWTGPNCTLCEEHLCSARPDYYRDRFLYCMATDPRGFSYCTGWMGCSGPLFINSEFGTITGTYEPMCF